MSGLLLGIVLSGCTYYYYYYYYYLTSGPYSSTSASFRITAHTNMPSAFFLHFLTTTDFINFQCSLATLILVFLLLILRLVSPEILSLWPYDQTFLLKRQPILVLLPLLLLQYLVFCTFTVIYY